MADNKVQKLRHLCSFESFDADLDPTGSSLDGTPEGATADEAHAFVAALAAAMQSDNAGVETLLERAGNGQYSLHVGMTTGQFDDWAIEGTVEVSASMRRASFRGSYDQPADDDEVSGDVHISYDGVTYCGNTIIGVESLATDAAFSTVNTFMYSYADEHMDAHGIYHEVAMDSAGNGYDN